MTADDYLRLAIRTGSPVDARGYAERGLRTVGDAMDAETRLLLLREIYRSHLYARRLRSAHAIARKMVRIGVAQELAHADLGRACAAMGWWVRAAQAYRIAARNAPASRRSLHWAQVGTALHHAGQFDEALSAYERAVRWSLGARALHRAQSMLAQVDRGDDPQAVEGLHALLDELHDARCGEGYGRYVRGLLHLSLGETDEARRNLVAFLKRNVSDPMRATTLSAEIRRARLTLRTMLLPRAG